MVALDVFILFSLRFSITSFCAFLCLLILPCPLSICFFTFLSMVTVVLLVNNPIYVETRNTFASWSPPARLITYHLGLLFDTFIRCLSLEVQIATKNFVFLLSLTSFSASEITVLISHWVGMKNFKLLYRACHDDAR